ncbi:MAG: hypothetical protein F9K38_14810 [Pseudorhodoplanes sp.]|nr:MAG: hypothetical protein F9K38_14810 [Pseudorhodoplanes sp.]
MAMAVPIAPFELSFDGRDADGHTADALYIGQSLQGIARLYNSVIGWHLHGRILAPAFQDVRVHVGPPKDGSLLYIIYMMMVHGKMAVYPEIFFELAQFLIPAAVKALIARRSGQMKIVEKQADAMLEMYRRYDEFARQVHSDHVREKGQLLDVLKTLADANRKPLADMTAPVGRTVKQIEHFKNLPEPVVVDEPIAEALRTQDGAVVGELEKYFGKLVAVDTVTGACKLLLDDSAKPIKGKITDPALAMPENPYTHALDTQTHVTVTAKPVSKNGKISTLYVSDAKPDEAV